MQQTLLAEQRTQAQLAILRKAALLALYLLPVQAEQAVARLFGEYQKSAATEAAAAAGEVLGRLVQAVLGTTEQEIGLEDRVVLVAAPFLGTAISHG
jgi:membrane protein YqaA with SNARE-associated domain